MNKIAPQIWCDQNALEAAEFYVETFKYGHIESVSHYFDGLFPDDFEGTIPPDGTVLYVDFEICGQRFGAVNGGPVFKPNPSISFFVVCNLREELDELWGKLVDGGRALMPLGEYPFSERFGWLEDRFGVSWQLILSHEQKKLNKISPYLLFTGAVDGRAEEAIGQYSGLFADYSMDLFERHGKDSGGTEGSVLHAEFRMGGTSFVAMDSSAPHPFTFSEGVSLMIPCDTQDEIDFYWEKLTEGGQEQPCGWLKDKFGVSWQVSPSELGRLTDESDKTRAARVNRAMLQMKKIDIQALWDAYNQ